MFAPGSARVPPPPVITVADPRMLGVEIQTWRLAIASAVWQGVRRILYLPLRVETPIQVIRLFHYNGTVVSGNVDIGIYTSANGQPASRLVNMGSAVAQAGTSALQIHTVSQLIGVGLHFLAIGLDNTTGTFFRWPVANELLRGWTGWQETLGSWTGLPATATPIAAVTGVMPVCGLASVAL